MVVLVTWYFFFRIKPKKVFCPNRYSWETLFRRLRYMSQNLGELPEGESFFSIGKASGEVRLQIYYFHGVLVYQEKANSFTGESIHIRIAPQPNTPCPDFTTISPFRLDWTHVWDSENHRGGTCMGIYDSGSWDTTVEDAYKALSEHWKRVLFQNARHTQDIKKEELAKRAQELKALSSEWDTPKE